jgi:hypothetical protein
MPAAVIQILLFFIVASILIGLAAWWIIGPRRPLAAILPVLGSFLTLYVIGHNSGLAVGPTVQLFGFEVNLLWDILCAALGAAIVAKAQCMVLTRRAARRAGI